jgi:hypothetical protein
VESVRGFHDGHIMHLPTAFRILYLPAWLKRKLSTNRLILKGVCLWAKEEPMKPIRIPTLNSEQLLDALEKL